MSRASSLLETLQVLIERTYGMRSGLSELGAYLIGDEGYRRFYSAGPVQHAAAACDPGARTLLRETEDGVRATIYYPDALIAALEIHPPQQGVDERNVDAFATLVEELDHLLLIAARARAGRVVTLFELELHANVTKYLVLGRFLARKGHLSPTARVWLRHQLFEKGQFCDEDEAVRRRYQDAARWAVRYLEGLSALDVETRLYSLRQFHRAGAAAKVAMIDELRGYGRGSSSPSNSSS